MIEVKDVTLKYQAINSKEYLEALKDINMEISKGERCVLLGPSGSGKTSFIFGGRFIKANPGPGIY